VVKISPAGVITLVAGNNIAGYSGDGGPATGASLNTPLGLRVDAAGNIYVADSVNSRIRKITPDGIISTVAGTGARGFGGDSGPAVNAALYQPKDVAVDATGNIYIPDWGNNRIRKVDASGVINTVAGSSTRGFSGDGGPATAAALQIPTALDIDRAGNLYIADYGNHRIRKVSTDGTITTIAGNGRFDASTGDGGPALDASVPFINGVAVASDGAV